MQKTVSIIIPVYNEKEYLKICVESVLRQTWKWMEIILVDDGSDQKTAELCDSIAKEDDRIQVIHKENEGLAFARETGMKKATGEWIFFIDSDDSLDGENALEILVRQGEKTGADIIVGNYRKQKGEQLTEKKNQHFFNEEQQRGVRFRFNGFIRDGHLAYEWAKLYRLAFLQCANISHSDHPFLEDKAFNLKCYMAGATYAFVDESVYKYRENQNGITFSYKTNFGEEWIRMIEEFEKKQKTLAREKQIPDLIATHLLLGFYYYGKQEIQTSKNPSEIKEKMKIYMENSLVQKYANLYRNERIGDGFGSILWKSFFDMLSWMVARHKVRMAYSVFRLLVGVGAESRVSESRYQKSKPYLRKMKNEKKRDIL